MEGLAINLLPLFGEHFGKKSPEASYGFVTESGLAWSLVKWLIDGEAVVFHIEASLVDAFLTSDIGEMAWRDVRLPFEEFVFAFRSRTWPDVQRRGRPPRRCAREPA